MREIAEPLAEDEGGDEVARVIGNAAIATKGHRRFALVDTLWLGVLLLVTAGAADTISVIFRATAVQLETPGHLRAGS